MIITNSNPGNFTTDGAYIDLIPPPPAMPTGPATGIVAIVGAANYGPKNTPTAFSTPSDLFNAFGNGTTIVSSLVDEALCAMPECKSFIGVRVTDGTDTSAVILMLDSSAATVLTLTAKYTGSFANASSARLDLVSGTTSAAPVYKLTINFPNAAAEVFTGIAGSASGGAYSSSVFLANALAAVNGTIAGQAGSTRWTATTGSSSIAPVAATNTAASGGTDGTASVVNSTLIGTDGSSGRTGLYALRGQVQGAIVLLAQNTTATSASALSTFAMQENCSVMLAYPSLTTTDTMIATQATNNLFYPNLYLAADWDYFYDSVSKSTFLHSPQGPLAAILASLPAYQYPGNKPAGAAGKSGIISTDRNGNPNTNPPSGASPLSTTEAGKRQAAGILYLTNNPNLYYQNSGYGLPHGMASDGKTLISDTRMTQSIAVSMQSILGKYVGSMIALINGKFIIVAPNGDPGDPQGALNAYFAGLIAGSTPQIAAYSNQISSNNNTVQQVQQGFLIASVFVTTLSAAKFILALTQVGNTVSIPTVTISQAG